MKRLARRLLPLVLVALGAGTIAAQADSGPKPPVAVPVPAAQAVPALQDVVGASGAAARVWYAGAACRPSSKEPKGAPPTQDLLNAFAILRRAPTPDDALPPEALKALERIGLAPVAADSARLLRSTASGGKAWVVPVPNARRASPFACLPDAARRKGRKFVRPAEPKPQEGLAVVALGDAAEGGGGTLGDLVRGRAPASVNICAGPDRTMLGVSGIVPDGVPAVFFTAPDGTAVKADVKDNGYEFLVPRPKTRGQRYVVWTGGDGTPHVQPLSSLFNFPARLCARKTPPSLAKLPRISPTSGGFAPCALQLPIVASVSKRPGGKLKRRVVRVPTFVDCAPPQALPMSTAPGAPPRAHTAPAPAPKAVPARPKKRG